MNMDNSEIKPAGYFYEDGDGARVESYECNVCENIKIYSNEELDDHMPRCHCYACEGYTRTPYYYKEQLDAARANTLRELEALKTTAHVTQSYDGKEYLRIEWKEYQTLKSKMAGKPEAKL